MPPLSSLCNLLIIDDNHADIRLMLEAIRIAGTRERISIEYTYDAFNAFSMLEQAHQLGNDFHIILLDLNMPKISGKDFLRVIKKDERYKNITVFILTNSDYSSDIEECMELGADAFLQKPAVFKRLIDFFISLKESAGTCQDISVKGIYKRYSELNTSA
jgi:CheY-like chemotaxis protein